MRKVTLDEPTHFYHIRMEVGANIVYFGSDYDTETENSNMSSSVAAKYNFQEFAHLSDCLEEQSTL